MSNLGQLWRLKKEGKLKNKNGDWKYSDIPLEIPKPGVLQFDNFITDKTKNMVLGFEDKNITIGSEVILVPIPEDPILKKQSYWKVILTKLGWFKIFHPLSGSYLTTKSGSKLTIEG